MAVARRFMFPYGGTHKAGQFHRHGVADKLFQISFVRHRPTEGCREWLYLGTFRCIAPMMLVWKQ